MRKWMRIRISCPTTSLEHHAWSTGKRKWMRTRLACPMHESCENDNKITDNPVQIVSKVVDVNLGAAITSI